MPFSVSAAFCFIALSGVAVLNGQATSTLLTLLVLFALYRIFPGRDTNADPIPGQPMSVPSRWSAPAASQLGPVTDTTARHVDGRQRSAANMDSPYRPDRANPTIR